MKIIWSDFASETLGVIYKYYKEAVSKNSNIDKLIDLKKLLDEGVITNEEFEKEKKKILDD